MLARGVRCIRNLADIIVESPGLVFDRSLVDGKGDGPITAGGRIFVNVEVSDGLRRNGNAPLLLVLTIFRVRSLDFGIELYLAAQDLYV